MNNVNPYRYMADYCRLLSIHTNIVHFPYRIGRLSTTMIRTVTTVVINLGLPLFYLPVSCLI